jgi:D-alanine transaminase
MNERPSAASKATTVAPVPLANLDGHILPLVEAKVSALDRGFLFGDAVYEVLRIYGGRAWFADEHFARLARSLAAVRITGVDLARLRERMSATIAAGLFREAIVYIQITRGSAPRRHTFPNDAAPLEFLYVQEFSDPYVEAREKGASVILQPDIRWGRCDIKSTNLLANVLALQAAKEAGCVEALLYLPDGTLTEASHSSLFGVQRGQLITAAHGPAILPGVTRDRIVALARQSEIAVCERNLHRNELFNVDELFLTGTTTEVLPIVRVDDQLIANGQPGPVTRRLRVLYQETVGGFRA